MDKKTLTTAGVVAVVAAGAMMVAGQGTTGTPVEDTSYWGRFAQRVGTVDQFVWEPNGADAVSIGPSTVLPEGMTVTVVDANIVIDVNAISLGTVTAIIDVRSYYPLDLDNWKGAATYSNRTYTFLWHKYVDADAPFMSGVGDILLGSSP